MTPAEAWAEVTFYWTPAGVLVALASAVALGWAVSSLRPRTDPTLFVWLLGIAGLLWYIPTMAQRLADPALVFSGLRSAGLLALFGVYVGVAAAVIEWRWRRRGER